MRWSNSNFEGKTCFKTVNCPNTELYVSYVTRNGQQVFYGRVISLKGDMGITQLIGFFVHADNRCNGFLTFELRSNIL